MSWVEPMKRDAARLAFPNWEERDGDRIDLVTDWDPAWSALTPGQGFTIWVIVRRNNEIAHSRVYENAEATKYFHALMKAGS